MTLEPPAANATACPKLTSGNLTRQYLRIGAPTGPNNLTRVPYDSNPFYFSFGSSDNDDSRCPYRPNKAYVGLTSSNDDYEHSQPWKLRAEKRDDAFELSGYASQHEASRGNYFTYTVNKTSRGVAGAGSDQNYPRFCIDEFSTTTLTARDAVRMSARVDAAGAVLTWSFIAARSGYNVSGEFRGAWWDKGARLVTNGSVLATEGEAERVWPSRPEGFLDRWGNGSSWALRCWCCWCSYGLCGGAVGVARRARGRRCLKADMGMGTRMGRAGTRWRIGIWMVGDRGR
jgi:hypothetical protein